MLNKLNIGLTLLLMPVFALALEFKSIGVPKAILYDGPSAVASKRFILYQYYPVEVIVSLSNWIKVRDAEGGIHWLESNNLSSTRTIIVKADTSLMHDAPIENSKLVASVEKDVVLKLDQMNPVNGWIKVSTLNGLSGYVPVGDVWGF
jgi:SH3-like domain-containing protein